METRSKKKQRLIPSSRVSCETFAKENLLHQQNSEDTPILLKVFPEELWSLILVNLDTATDFQNARNSSQLFAQLMQPQCKNVLFSSVFKVIYKRYQIYETIPELRQVCRLWKRSVDHTLQNLDDTFLFKTDKKFSISLASYDHIHGVYSPVFQSVDDISAFELRFPRNSSNPFVTRQLFVHIRDELDLWLERLEEMLQHYGIHIWYFEIHLDFNLSLQQQMEFYKSLIIMMARLENLKALRVRIAPSEYFCKAKDAELKLCLEQVSVPTLPKLQFVFLNKVNPILGEEIFCKNPQINHSETGYWDEGTTKRASLKLLPNLQNFSTFAEGLPELETIFPTTLNCTLVKLNLMLVDVEWPAAFKILEKRCASLQELKIGLSSNYFPEGKQSLELPNLKTLAIKVKICQPLDFILPMKRYLEEISVTVHHPYYEFMQIYAGREGIRIEGSNLRMVPSNLCTLFPKLKRLSVQGRACTRIQWMQLSEQV